MSEFASGTLAVAPDMNYYDERVPAAFRLPSEERTRLALQAAQGALGGNGEPVLLGRGEEADVWEVRGGTDHEAYVVKIANCLLFRRFVDHQVETGHIMERTIEDNPPPLAVPLPLWDEMGLGAAAFTKVPGRQLSYAELAKLSSEERQVLGAQIGSFALWTTDIKWPADLREDNPHINFAPQKDIKGRLRHRGVLIEPLYAAGFPSLGDAISKVLDDWRAYHEKGQLVLDQTGHDDLRLGEHGNVLHTLQDGLLVPSSVVDTGVFDTNSQRILRHLAPIGDDVLDAGLRAAALQPWGAGHEPREHSDKQLVRTWALAQVVGATAYNIVEHGLVRETNKHALRMLLPGLDWAELDRPIPEHVRASRFQLGV